MDSHDTINLLSVLIDHRDDDEWRADILVHADEFIVPTLQLTRGRARCCFDKATISCMTAQASQNYAHAMINVECSPEIDMSAAAISGARNPSIPSSSSPISDMANDAWLELPSGEDTGRGSSSRWLEFALDDADIGAETGEEKELEKDAEVVVEIDVVEDAVKLAR
jgi:hypothetical protein